MSETMWVLWDNFFYCVKYHKLIFSFSISLTLFKIFQKVSCCFSSSVRHFKCLIYVEYEYTIKGMREALHIQEYLTWAVKMETCWWLVFHHWIHFQNWQGGFRGKIELLFLVLSLIRMTHCSKDPESLWKVHYWYVPLGSWYWLFLCAEDLLHFLSMLLLWPVLSIFSYYILNVFILLH